MRERTFRDWFWIGLLVFLQLLPIVAVFLNSVAVDWAGTILPDGYTLDHIRNITSDPRFNQSIVNSLIVAIGSLVITPLICVPAILVAHCYFPMLDKWMAGLVILPYAVPGIVLALGLLRLYSGNYGVVLNGTPWVLIFGYMPLAAPLYYVPIKSNLRALARDRPVRGGTAARRFRSRHHVAHCAALREAGADHRPGDELHPGDQRFRLRQSSCRRAFSDSPDFHGGAEWRQRPQAQRSYHHLFHRYFRGYRHRCLGFVPEK